MHLTNIYWASTNRRFVQEGTLKIVEKIFIFTELPIVAGPCSAQKRMVFPQMCEFAGLFCFRTQFSFSIPTLIPSKI